MRKLLCFLAAVTLLLCSCNHRAALTKGTKWDENTGTFSWWSGEVKLPAGYSYQEHRGVDTFVGHFTGSNKGLTVYYDIGGPAGAYASRNAANSFSERIVEGARVWTAKKDWPDGKGGRTVLVAVTFPDSGCANFYLKSPKNEDAAVIDFIAQSFHPNGPIQPSSLCH